MFSLILENTQSFWMRYSQLTGRASLTRGLSSALGGAAIGGLLGGFRAGALAREAGGYYWNGDGTLSDITESM